MCGRGREWRGQGGRVREKTIAVKEEEMLREVNCKKQEEGRKTRKSRSTGRWTCANSAL